MSAVSGRSLPVAATPGGLVALGDADAGACVDGLCLVPTPGSDDPAGSPDPGGPDGAAWPDLGLRPATGGARH